MAATGELFRDVRRRGMNAADGTVRRVAICSDQTLVAQVVEPALASRGFEPVVVDLGPEDGQMPVLAGDIADVGLMIMDMTTAQSIHVAQVAVRASLLPVVVVAGTPRGPAWGAVLAAGAAVVIDSSFSLAEIVEVLNAVVAGTFVPDADLDRELVREWELGEH